MENPAAGGTARGAELDHAAKLIGSENTLPAVIAQGGNRLPVLCGEIRAAHADVATAVKASSERALAAGALLTEAKALCGHGQWLPFLKETGISERTAQRYMTLADGKLESDTVSDLGGPTSALRFLKLRRQAEAALREAEAAALADGDDVDELEPMERALDLIVEMIRMFPDYSDYGRTG